MRNQEPIVELMPVGPTAEFIKLVGTLSNLLG